MNQIIITGHLGKDPELKKVGEYDLCSFSVAVTKKFKEKGTTTWFNVSVWNKLAELCQKYLSKGSKVLIVGEMQCDKYEEKYYWKVNANSVEFLSTKPKEEEHKPPALDKPEVVTPETGKEILPF